MRFTKSAGAVIFYRSSAGQIEYLLLNHGESEKKSEIEYWNFPKGIMEKGESEIETAKREIAEETGLVSLFFLPKFKAAERYFYREKRALNKGELIFKIVNFFLAEAKDKNVKISSEHVGWKWLDFTEANQQIKFKSSRKILIKADKFLHDYLAKKSIRGS